MTSAIHKRAEPEWRSGEADARGLKRVRLGDTLIELEVMIHGGELSELTPLLIINSIDYPMPPSKAFCETMEAAGYQTIFIRRPGFGHTRPLPSVLMKKQEIEQHAPVATEAALIKLWIDSMDLKGIRLLGLGTSNSICLRLNQMSDAIDFVVFSNPLFNPAIWNVIRPAWLKRMIRQTVLSESGLKIAVRGLRAVLRRDPLWFYRQFAQKSAGDVAYIKANESDFLTAGMFLQKLEPDMYFYELRSALMDDNRWNPAHCENIDAVILSGTETTENWKGTIVEEADRLGLPIVFANAGDLFVPYASPDSLLEILKNHSASVAAL
ncbi:MAG: hypothetical protein AAFQ12_01600 [Pseudomonadota bacterium]